MLALIALTNAGCAPLPAARTDGGGVASNQTAQQPAHSEQTDGVARAKLQERVYVDGPYVTPLEVVKDTRCPTPLQCYVAGDLHVKVRVDLGSRSEELVLKNNELVHIADGNLRIVEATPQRRIAKKGGSDVQPIAPEEYRFGFRFMGGY